MKKNKKDRGDATRKILTEDELCEMWQVSRCWLYERRTRDGLPFIRVNGLLRYDSDKVQTWLDQYHKICAPRQSAEMKNNGGNSNAK